MCQLIYSNTGNMYINSYVVYFLSKNGSTRHHDGCGIMCSDNSIWKDEHAAKDISNLGEILYECITDDAPVPFHIRMATYGIKVTKDNAHPFEGKHYILMHNGTLVPADEPVKKNYTNNEQEKDSDSAKFLAALDNARDKNPDRPFAEIFNEAMIPFAGKFAFIIREKDSNKNYIVRGRTAELWISYVDAVNGEEKERIGYIIDTSPEVIKDSVNDIINTSVMATGVAIEFEKPVLLKQETIFLAEKLDVTEIAATIEKEPIKEVVKALPPLPRNNQNWVRTSFLSDDVKKIFERSKKVYKFLDDHCLGVIDLSILLQEIGGISVLELNEQDLAMLCDNLIPKLSANDKIRKHVKSQLKGGFFPAYIYKNFNLEYPWMLNSDEKIKEALRKYSA